MKRFALIAALCAGVISLPGCSAAEGLAKTMGRTVSTATRTVGTAASSITR